MEKARFEKKVEKRTLGAKTIRISRIATEKERTMEEKQLEKEIKETRIEAKLQSNKIGCANGAREVTIQKSEDGTRKHQSLSGVQSAASSQAGDY